MVQPFDRAKNLQQSNTNQQYDKNSQLNKEQHVGRMHQPLDAEKIIGANVENLQQESLGQVKTFMLDNLGHVSCVVLARGGFMGINKQLIAMPWSIFSFDNDRNCFLIDTTVESLKNAQGFDRDNWPNMSDTHWLESLQQFDRSHH